MCEGVSICVCVCVLVALTSLEFYLKFKLP